MVRNVLPARIKKVETPSLSLSFDLNDLDNVRVNNLKDIKMKYFISFTGISNPGFIEIENTVFDRSFATRISLWHFINSIFSKPNPFESIYEDVTKNNIVFKNHYFKYYPRSVKDDERYF